MGYASRLVSRILADERARGNRLVNERVYHDEPILRTGADLMRDAARAGKARGGLTRPSTPITERPLPPTRTAIRKATARVRWSSKRADRFEAFDSIATGNVSKPAVELPFPLRQLRERERQLDAWLAPSAKSFVQEALIVADYEDDYRYDGEYRQYFPTYRSMDDAQLRGYFSWRTRARRGDIRKTSLSFAYVYLYELINSIGPAGIVAPDEGYATLRGFCRAYGRIDPRILRHARSWCTDYALCHGLDIEPTADELERQTALKTLLDCDEGKALDGDEALFDALATLSSYRIAQSRLMHDEEALLRSAACGSWRALASYYRSHRKKTLFEHLFGALAPRPYALFGTALFWQPKPHENAERRAGPLVTYSCEKGRWTRTSLHGADDANRELGSLMKAVDATLRRRLGSSHPLKDPAIPKYMQRIIDRQVDILLVERQEREAQEERKRSEEKQRQIKIDFTRLASIRAEAARSCEALLVDEEREESDRMEQAAHGAPSIQMEPAQDEKPSSTGGDRRIVAETAKDDKVPIASPSHAGNLPPSAAPADGNLFSVEETSYLRCLLRGLADVERAAAVKDAGISEAMMMDVINEKALDILGDIVLEDIGEGPQIIEDYRDDMKGFVGA